MGETKECIENFGGENLLENVHLEDQEGDLKIEIFVKICEEGMWT
jgi:hypothetical protein